MTTHDHQADDTDTLIERFEQVLRVSSALAGFSGNDSGQSDRGTRHEMAGHLDVHFAGKRRDMGAEQGGDRNRILDHR